MVMRAIEKTPERAQASLRIDIRNGSVEVVRADDD
jgi:hypothetical protein